MISRTPITAIVLLVFLPGVAAARDPKGLELVPVAVPLVTVEVGCGPTPVPGKPPPTCPPDGVLKLVYAGYGCHSEDFEIRVRQREHVQLVTVYRRLSASSCVIADGIHSFASRLRAVYPSSGDIVPGKPIRLLNPVPIALEPRP